MKQVVRTRIAPSPTGEDLHIGSVYMALFNYVFAKKYGGDFIIRVEDTDRERYVKGAEERMLASLAWVGIPHDEGVDMGGEFGPYRQSERLGLYKKYAQQLIENGSAYYCFCTQQRLQKLRLEQQRQQLPPMYDGLCKQIPLKRAQKRAETEPYVVRLNVPDAGESIFTDLVRGRIVFQNKLIDDQVLLKSDGFPTYHLAVVVDDHLMKITHIIRGEEWISSTPKHILLYQALGWAAPQYAHLPLLRNPDKSKLSKRKNPVWVSWFRKEGFLPEAILNYLGTLTWSSPDGSDMFSLKDMIRNFKITDVKTTAPIFNIEKLRWLNGQYIMGLSTPELNKRLTESVSATVDKKLIKKLAPLSRERLKTLAEFSHYLKPFIHYVPYRLTNEQKQLINSFLEAYRQLVHWQTSELEAVSKRITDKEALPLREAFMALRLAVTGEKIGLPLFETFEILGKKEVVRRLSSA